MSISLLIVCPDFSRQSTFFDTCDGFEVIAATDSGASALDFLSKRLPDLIICDLIMKDVDGITFIERCKKDYPAVKTVVYTGFDSDEMIKCAKQKGATEYLTKYTPLPIVAERICKIATQNDFATEEVSNYVKWFNAAELRISNIFLSAGIPPHIRGYGFLREGVLLAVKRPEILGNITKELYPAVAEKYNTTPSKVERAIRHAIEVAWARGRIESLNGLFGVTFYRHGDKPTNGELIALIADRIIQEMHMGRI